MKKIIGFFSITALLLFLAPEPKVEGQIGYQITASQVAAATNITYTAPVAGTGTDTWAMAQTILAMDGSDTVRGLFIDLTNANHTGSSNVLNGIEIDSITGDVQATEYSIFTGSGWDYGIYLSNAVTAELFLAGTSQSHLRFSVKQTIGDGGKGLESLIINNLPDLNVDFADTYMIGVGDGDTIAAMDGSDTYAMLKVDFTNADHTGSSNLLYGLDIEGITGDAQATESGLHIGEGWDYNILFASSGAGTPAVIAFDNNGALRISDASSQTDLYVYDANSRIGVEVDTAPAIMDGSDTTRGIFIDILNANHTGSSNVLAAIEIDDITGDAEADEFLFRLGNGFDYLIDDVTNTALGTLTWSTNSDKSGNTASGTLKVNINGTLYHIQLYADS